ncbi:hypothetical protein TI03_01460 [Achromatium sp. WMS1]|nr:hypothetical protein TI03_01460 [Achromatium sp. WMS1]
MNQDKRQNYLAAMGIPLWLPKRTQSQKDIMTDTAFKDTTIQPTIATMSWDMLAIKIPQCQLCPELVANRSRTVLGVGNHNARLLLIGEAPGVDEDQQGEPFVGRAGKLLTSMLNAIGLQREEVYIANILKCRPPNNRDPSEEEALHCQPWLLRQIELIAPELILAVGRIAAHNLLQTKTPIGKLRGQVYQYGQRHIPLIVTYHPSYLLRSPSQKVHAWEDLQRVITLLNQNLPVAN